MTQMHHHTLPSKDGTAILSYYTIGTGPGLIILHGANCTASTHSELATLLSSSYTVHLLERRGRGDSGTFPLVMPEFRGDGSGRGIYAKEFCGEVMRIEREDVEVLIKETGARFCIGVSIGAVILLDAMLEKVCTPG